MSLGDILKKLNFRLDCVTIVTRPKSKKLYLRATLPPKPGEDKPKQRYLPTGKPASEYGAKQADLLAKRLDLELIKDEFNWYEWDPKLKDPDRQRTIAELVQELIDLKRLRVTSEVLKQRYIVPLGKLPQTKVLTEQVCRDTLERECTGYPTKWQMYAITYASLCNLGEVEHNLKSFGPRKPEAIKPINPEDLPSDEVIVETWDSIKNRAYRIFFARMACYGLRPHECWKCVVSEESERPYCRVSADTKTGRKTSGREVLPFLAEWYTLMEPWQDFSPYISRSCKWETASNARLGHIISKWFGKNIPFNAYMLRHAWACRTARLNFNPAIAAQMMGHSYDIHTTVYHKALGEDARLAAWRSVVD